MTRSALVEAQIVAATKAGYFGHSFQFVPASEKKKRSNKNKKVNVLDSPNCTESKIGKVLLIGVTGGTGGNVVKGFLEQGVTNLPILLG